ncbi:hypothetical protein A8135_05325 [Legionella jamestowniensis]|uniref:Substrate of the Dot/Icm secretion system n=1 Tax=Legionella jamestowniensis TaxID=455 RepID=A0ABX2XR12_9GAMM|nr:hypothetical protein [Legionella jamestowniensis]OCH97054.1 hypothetical protein A8135_05325 [Legionella jamestowniensis]
MLIYLGQQLTKFKDKIGGKNQHEIDGFYRDEEGHEFFIKKPADINELFTELFAGLLIDEFKRRDLIPKHYHDSFICATYIRLEDGSYALIQPKVSFKELYKIIGTGNKEGSDRHVLMEILFGPDYYVSLTEIKNQFGLSFILMLSLLIGDYSVHSGNVVCLDSDTSDTNVMQFARIDLGAAFRNFGCKENHTNILNPVEYQGWFNPAALTKGYFLNYKKIIGLFPAMAEKATELHRQLDNALLEDILAAVFATMPADLINHTAKEKLAKYLGIDSFNQVTLGSHQVYPQFSQDFIEIFNVRLKKIGELQDLIPANQGKLYRSLNVEDLRSPAKLALITNDNFSFIEQMEVWQETLTDSETTLLAVNNIDLAVVSHKFNDFLNAFLQQIEFTCHDNHKNTQPSWKDSQTLTFCPEAAYLRDSFLLKTDSSPLFNDKELEKVKKNLDSPWKEVKHVLTACLYVVITIRIAKEIHSSDNLEDTNNYALSNLFFNLKEHLNLFIESYQLFMERFIFPNCPLKKNSQTLEASFPEPSVSGKNQFFKAASNKEFSIALENPPKMETLSPGDTLPAKTY